MCCAESKGKKEMINRYKLNRYIKNITSYTLLGFFVAFAVFPILYIILSSFKDPLSLWSYPPKIFSGKLTLEHYLHIAKEFPSLFHGLKNSIIITFGSLLLTLILSFASAFAFSRYKSKFLQVPVLFLIIIRMFAPIIITIPLYPVLASIGLVDNHFTLIVINCAFSISLATFLMKAFIDDVPIELEESAMIDGCSKLNAFLKITLPLVSPGIAAVTIFVAVGIWNEYVFAYIFSSSAAITAPVVIATIRSDVMGVNWGGLFAACIIQLMPMLILVIIAHKYLVKGIQTGAIK